MKIVTLEDIEQNNIEKVVYTPPPPRSLNGGLFTGEPFEKDAPWANVPVVPDVTYMTNINLRSANPPVQALFQYPGNTRPGNNYQENTGLTVFEDNPGFKGKYNFSCLPCSKMAEVEKSKNKKCNCKNIAPISGNEVNICNCDKLTYIDL